MEVEKDICPQCFGEKKYMTEKVSGKTKGLHYKECTLCDEEGMVVVEDDDELDY